MIEYDNLHQKNVKRRFALKKYYAKKILCIDYLVSKNFKHKNNQKITFHINFLNLY